MRWRLAVLGAVWLGGAATLPLSCAGAGADTDLQPPPSYVPPVVHPLQGASPDGHGQLRFLHGFWPLELAEGKSWRWMDNRGEIRLPNRHKRQRLRIVGWLPLEFLGRPPTIQITLGKHPLDRFVGAEVQLNREYLVDPELLGDAASALLVIETSATAVVPGDPRDLGVAIEAIEWRDAR